MKNKQSKVVKQKSTADSLRQKALELMEKRLGQSHTAAINETDILKLLHELEVHQIELEMQNQELILAKNQTDLAMKKYVGLYDFAPSGYFTISNTGKIITLNLTGAQMLGKERARLKNSNFTFFVSNKTKPVFNDFLKKIFTGKTNETCEVTIETKGNAPRYVHLTGIVADIDEQCLVTATDITAQKQENEKLLQSEERYKSLFLNNHSVMIFIEPETGKIKDANAAACNYYGYTLSEICSKNISEINTLTQAEVKQEMRLAIAEKRKQFFFKHKKANGEIRDVEVYAGPIKFGNSTLLYSIVNDVTERRKLQHDLNERIKELNCHNHISEVMSNSTLSIEEVCGQIVQLITDGLQFPDITQALIQIGDDIYKTDNFKKSKNFLHQKIKIKNQEIGFIEVYLSNHKLPASLQLFQPEEANLLLSIAERLGTFIEKKETDNVLHKSEEKFSKAFQTAPYAILITRIEDGTFIDVNDAFCSITGYSREEALENSTLSLDIWVDPEERKKVITQLIETGKVSETEYLFKRKNGETLVGILSASIISLNNYNYILSSINDVTANKQAQEKLRLSEEKYRNIFEGLQDAYYESSFDGTILEISPSIEVMSNGQYTRNELIGKSLSGLYADLEDRNSIISELKKHGRVTDYEVLMRNKDGSFVPAAISSSLLFDANKNPIKISGNIRNITERKQAEKALKKSNQQWEAIIAASPDGIGMVSLDGKMQLISDKLASMYGYSIAEKDLLIGQPVFNFIDPSNHASIHENIQRLVSGEILQLITEYVALRKDKSRFDSEQNSTLLRNSEGNPDSILFVQRDITSRKKAEMSLQESEKKFRNIFETMQDTYYEATTDGILLEVSPSIEMLSKGQYKRDELIGKSFIGMYAYPDDRNRFFTELFNQGSLSDFELMLNNKDGALVPVSISSRILFDAEGKPLKIAGSIRDVTQRKLAEEALRESESLYKAVLNASPDDITITDLTGTILFASPKSLTMFGYQSMEQLIGLNITGFIIAEDLERAKSEIIKMHEGTITGPAEYKAIRADLTVFDIEVNGEIMRDDDGTPTRMVFVVRDVTDRVTAEQNLVESEEKFRTIAEQTSDFIAISNSNGLITYASPASATVFHIPPEAMIGRNFIGFVAESEIARAIQTFEECLENNSDIKNAEFTMKRDDGTTFTGELNASKFQTGTQFGTLVTIRDITERKNSEMALRESEKKFQTIIQSQAEGIGIINQNEVFEFTNLAATKIFETDNLVGVSLFDFLHPDEIIKINQQTERRSQGISEDYELHILTKNGNAKYILVSSTPKFDENNNYLGAYGVFRDITERKLAEEALRASEEKYRLLFYNNPQPMWIYDIETLAYIEVNQAAITHYGYSRDEFLKMTLRDIRPAEDIEDLMKDVELSKNKQSSQTEWRHLRKNKELRIVEITAQSLIFNGRNARHVLINDITERKKAEEELRKFRTISDQANYGATVSGLDGSFIYVNNAFARMHGYEPDELIGKDYKIIHNEEQLARAEEIMTLIKTKRGLISEEIYHTRKDVTTFPTLMSAAVIYNEKGIPQFLSTTTIDITESKLSEQKIRDLNENLETRIIERTIELEETNEILQTEIQSRMLVETELALEKHRLSEIIEGTNVGTWEWNIQTGQAIFNERWAEIIGYTLEELAPVSIETWTKFVHPDDIKILGQLMKKHFKGELAYYSFESRMKHKNGEWVWVLDRGKVHDWDIDHKPLLMSGTHQDITESKRAQEFETELLQLTLQLTGIPVSEIAPALNMALHRIGSFLGADRAYIFEINEAEKTMSNTFEWCNHGINPEIENLKDVPLEVFPKWMGQLQVHENIIIPSVKNLPDDWAAEREILEPQGIQSLISIPIIIENTLIGFVGLDSVTKKREYKESEINILKVWSNMLASLINHQRKEEFIEQTRRNYETFFNTIDDFLFVLDLQGNMIHTNTTVSRRLGYSTDELLGKSVLMVHPAEHRDEAGRIVGEMLAGSSEFCPVPLVTKSGEYIPVETRVKHGFWDGKAAIFGVTKDISQIKLSEEKFSKAFQSNSALMAISTLDGRFLDVNDTFLKTLGFTREEVIGNNTHNLQIYDNIELRDEMVEKLRQNIPAREYEMKIKTKSGKERTGLFSADTIYIGKDLCLLTMMVDITERKRSEEALRESENRFSLFMDYLPAVVFLKDHEGRTLFINKYMDNAFGASRWVGKTMLEVFPNDFGAKLVADDLKVMKLGYQKLEESMIQLDGKLHFYETQKFAINRLGLDPLLGGISLDITERKQAEEKINQARDEAEKANRAKSEFLSRMSHELRTPMNSILGFAQLMEMGELDPKQKKGVGHILTAGRYLLKLINEVLDISRIEAGRLVLQLESIAVVQVINEILDSIHPQITGRQITLEFETSSASQLFVEADHLRLKQVLLNLLSNAIKYNRIGGLVRIKTEMMPATTEVIVPVRISITSTGEAISAENILKLFDPFERIGAEKTETQGTGLGLTVVKSLIEAMNGTIGVESLPGEGNTFWIELPMMGSQKSNKELTEQNVKLTANLAHANDELTLQKEEKEKRAAELKIANIELAFQNEEKENRATEIVIANKELAFRNENEIKTIITEHQEVGTILYVEDNLPGIELVQGIISRYRPLINLIITIYGNNAAKLAIENKPDLILLDLDLPDIHGSEVLKNLKAEPQTSAIPVVIVSADAMHDKIEKLMQAGASDYLTKPLDIVAFLRVVDKWIGKE